MPGTIAACATAVGGECALLRLSGEQAFIIAERAGLSLAPPWQAGKRPWRLGPGDCPCRVLCARGPRSFTGYDLVEIVLPGSRDVVELALTRLHEAGAQEATPGGFARQALATGRIDLVQAEAILALSQAPTAAAASLALTRLRGAFAEEIAAVRNRLLQARALVEAGLDFLDEADVRPYDVHHLAEEMAELRAILARWRVAAADLEGEPCVCLVGPANAGKSALFNRLIAGSGPAALVSPHPGTTRDWLDGTWQLGERSIRLIDTAGWLEGSVTAIDEHAVASGTVVRSGAALLLACSAPDAPLPMDHGLPEERTLVIATKADLEIGTGHDPRASLAVSATTGAGCPQLAAFVAARLDTVSQGTPRQARLLDRAQQALVHAGIAGAGDELIAEELRCAGEALGELLGATTPDEILDAIFVRFCIGK